MVRAVVDHYGDNRWSTVTTRQSRGRKVEGDKGSLFLIFFFVFSLLLLSSLSVSPPLPSFPRLLAKGPMMMMLMSKLTDNQDHKGGMS